MTDHELKKNLKKLAVIVVLAVIIIIGLSVYTLNPKKSQLSIYTSLEYSDALKTYGINEEEFKQYLSIFGNLVIDDFNDEQKNLSMITSFIDEACSVYEAQIDEVGNKTYEPEIMNKISKEIQGKSFKRSENYIVNKDEVKKIPYCKEIQDITKNGDKIEVVYKIVMLDSNNYNEFQNGTLEEDPEEYKVKAVILVNEEYEYSKYFINSIEKIAE